MHPRTTKRRKTTNLKTKNNQNCQKIELYGSPTTKELKKKHSSRLVGGAEIGSRGEEASQQGCSWQNGQSHNCVWITRKDNWGARQTMQPRFPAGGNKASKPQAIKTCGSCGSGRNSQLHRRVCWRDPQGPRMYTNTHTWESAPEGPNLLVGSRGSD